MRRCRSSAYFLSSTMTILSRKFPSQSEEQSEAAVGISSLVSKLALFGPEESVSSFYNE